MEGFGLPSSPPPTFPTQLNPPTSPIPSEPSSSATAVGAERGDQISLLDTRRFIQPGVIQRYRKPIVLPSTTELVDVLAATDYGISLGPISKGLVWLFARPPRDFDWRQGVSNHTARRTVPVKRVIEWSAGKPAGADRLQAGVPYRRPRRAGSVAGVSLSTSARRGYGNRWHRAPFSVHFYGFARDSIASIRVTTSNGNVTSVPVDHNAFQTTLTDTRFADITAIEAVSTSGHTTAIDPRTYFPATEPTFPVTTP